MGNCSLYTNLPVPRSDILCFTFVTCDMVFNHKNFLMDTSYYASCSIHNTPCTYKFLVIIALAFFLTEMCAGMTPFIVFRIKKGEVALGCHNPMHRDEIKVGLTKC
jgi:hypothetical protein